MKLEENMLSHFAPLYVYSRQNLSITNPDRSSNDAFC